MNIVNSTYHYSFYIYGKLRTLCCYYFPNVLTPDMEKVSENIYIGNLSSTINLEDLKTHNIKHIISAVSGVYPLYPDEINYTCLDLLDESFFDIFPVFDETNKIIDAINDDEKILIHCICGVSRSVTIVCAYLIYKHGYTPEVALNMIKKHRSIANPNIGFIEQLNNYYNKLYPNEIDQKKLISNN